MQVTVTIPDELAAQVQSRGLTPQSYVERKLTGTVVDQNKAPLDGAVVKVENIKAQSIESYVTGPTGHFSFKRLDPGTDYRFFATWHGHHSKDKHLGMFDSHRDETVELKVKTN